jgi:RsiW-degrading membrane proteinase PrsW (M82 family)
MILLLSAIFPVAVFLFFIFRKDTEKEPIKLLAKCFLWGCIATVPVILIELVLDLFNVFTSAFWHSFYKAFIVAAFTEEGVKFLFLYWIIWKHKECNQYFDGIVYAVFVSLGFAVIENILYVFNFNGLSTAINRAIFSVPAHGLFGVIMGYFFTLARFSETNKKRKFLWMSFLVPLIFHGLYDFVLFYMEKSNDNITFYSLLFVIFIVVMVFLWHTGIKHIKQHYAKDISEIKERGNTTNNCI